MRPDVRLPEQSHPRLLGLPAVGPLQEGTTSAPAFPACPRDWSGPQGPAPAPPATSAPRPPTPVPGRRLLPRPGKAQSSALQAQAPWKAPRGEDALLSHPRRRARPRICLKVYFALCYKKYYT